MQFPCSCCVPSSGCCCSVQFCFSLCSIRPIAFVLVCFLQISHFLCIWTLSLVCFWGHPPLQCCFGDALHFHCSFIVRNKSSEVKQRSCCSTSCWCIQCQNTLSVITYCTLASLHRKHVACQYPPPVFFAQTDCLFPNSPVRKHWNNASCKLLSHHSKTFYFYFCGARFHCQATPASKLSELLSSSKGIFEGTYVIAGNVIRFQV